MINKHLTFSLDEVENFGDAKEWTLIHNGMPLVSIISMKGDEWERKV